MKKCGSKIALSLIAALAMVFAFATCSIDDVVADSSENGGNVSQGAEQGECGEAHKWNNGEIIKAATENDDGEKKFTCTKCGKTKTETIPALGHSHTVASEWTFDEAHHWHDVSCGNESHKDKSAHEWDDGKITKAATESDDGEKKFTCATCKSTKTEAIPALGHSHTVASEWASDEEFHWHEASCGKEGHRTDKTAHEWNDGKVTTAPTCTAEGERTYACTACGKTRTEPVAASGHEWNDGEITKAATENDDGEKTFTCTKCNETRTEAIPALGHEHTVASGWTSDEKFHWHEASCGREAHRTDKTEHVWNTGEITIAPTCTTEGKRTYTCTVCGKTKTEPVATSEHNYNTTWKRDASGHWKECIDCGKKGNFAGHADMIATLTSDGKRKETCSTCGYGGTTSAWTKDTLSELSDALKNYADVNAKVKVVGELSDTNAIAAALLEVSSKDFRDDPSKLVALDLSGTTGLTTISFKDCSSLTSILLPRDVTEIGEMAFYNCNRLASIIIPESVTKIGEGAFRCCRSLETITIPNGVTEIESSTFSGCSSLTSIIIPKNVTKIGSSAFSSCESLTSIAIPNSVTEIGQSAFNYCSVLKSITIPNGVTKIELYTFANCKSLTSITIPNSVTEIGEWVFSGCDSLKSVELPQKITEICKLAFAHSGFENIELPKELTKIDSYAFSFCKYLKSIKIPASVTWIGGAAFSDCVSLDTVEFEDTSGWYAIDIVNKLEEPISSYSLENPSQLAKRLRNQGGGESTYWIKK